VIVLGSGRAWTITYDLNGKTHNRGKTRLGK
jgi:hypothetical protein